MIRQIPKKHVPRNDDVLLPAIAFYSCMNLLSKSEIIRITDLENGSVQRALDILCKWLTIRKLDATSPEYEAIRVQRQLRTIEPANRRGGRPPTLYAPGPKFQPYESKIEAVARQLKLGQMLNEDLGEARKGVANTHHVSLTAKLVADDFGKFNWGDPNNPLWTHDPTQRNELFSWYPTGAKRSPFNVNMNYRWEFESDGLTWRAKYTASAKSHESSTLVVELAAGSEVEVDSSDGNKVKLWLWNLATKSIRTLERTMGIHLQVQTTFGEFGGPIHAASIIENEEVQGIMDKMAKNNVDPRFNMHLPDGTVVWLDKSRGKWELEVTLDDIEKLEEMKETVVSSLLKQQNTPDYLAEMLALEFKALHQRMQTIEDMLKEQSRREKPIIQIEMEEEE